MYNRRMKEARLKAETDPALTAILYAIDEVVTNKIEVCEKVLINKIEALRRKLKTGIFTESEKEMLESIYKNKIDEVSKKQYTLKMGIKEIKKAAKNDAKGPVCALALFKTIRKVNPRTCLELGTSLGISALYQSSALMLNAKKRKTSYYRWQPSYIGCCEV